MLVGCGPCGRRAAGSTASHWFLLGLLGTASFFQGYDLNLVAVALKQIRHTFGLTQAGASLWLERAVPGRPARGVPHPPGRPAGAAGGPAGFGSGLHRRDRADGPGAQHLDLRRAASSSPGDSSVPSRRSSWTMVAEELPAIVAGPRFRLPGHAGRLRGGHQLHPLRPGRVVVALAVRAGDAPAARPGGAAPAAAGEPALRRGPPRGGPGRALAPDPAATQPALARCCCA